MLSSRSERLSLANRFGLTPLMVALMYGADVALVRVLALLTFAVTHARADFRNGNCALHYAAQLHNAELVDALLTAPTTDEHRLLRAFENDDQATARKTETDKSYEQALMQTVCAATNARNYEGETPLHVAVRSSDPQITCRLLDAGADPCVEVIACI